MTLLALAVRAAVVAERDRRRHSFRSDQGYLFDTLVLRVPPRQPGPPLVWLFTGDRHGVWFRGSFPVGA